MCILCYNLHVERDVLSYDRKTPKSVGISRNWLQPAKWLKSIKVVPGMSQLASARPAGAETGGARVPNLAHKC